MIRTSAMSDDIPRDATFLRPSGGETYTELTDKQGSTIVLTYNDLWMLIVCRKSLDGDWIRLREAAGMVVDPARKRALAERLWRLEQQLDGLPAVPESILKLNLLRAHDWFNLRMVSEGKNQNAVF